MFAASPVDARDCSSESQNVDRYKLAEVIVTGTVRAFKNVGSVPCSSHDSTTDECWHLQFNLAHPRTFMRKSLPRVVTIDLVVPRSYETVCPDQPVVADGAEVMAFLTSNKDHFKPINGLAGIEFIDHPEWPRVGDAVEHISNSVSCELESWEETYRVGDHPQLLVSILNKSPEPITLVGSLDASEWLRYPRVYFEVVGPDYRSVSVGGCGTYNPLRQEDLATVAAGSSFDPYRNGYSHLMREGSFGARGDYTFTFIYDTARPELKWWVNSPGRIDPGIVELLRHLPAANIRCSITVHVTN